MKKLIVCASLLCIGMLFSCSKDELVPEDEKPEWLGSSVYEELQNPRYLQGTFTNFKQLVDDLGYKEVLERTGSVTLFPANDEAFERFYASNSWGVKSYAGLTDAMKKQLLYSAMLENAMLVNMLSNVPAGSGSYTVDKGQAVRHQTGASVIDTITTIYNGAMMPQNNSFWDRYRQGGINLVYDATRPMMVHFTFEQMVNNGITTSGDASDFEIITGSKYEKNEDGSNPAFIFKDRIIKSDITCQNGYIHQVQDVIVPPGNIAQVLRDNSDTKLMSRIMDYHCAPFYDASTTDSYNSWALKNNKPLIDSIYQVRYFSSDRSAGSTSTVNTGLVKWTDPKTKASLDISKDNRLNWDPGWNQYYPAGATTLDDMGALLCPTDEAIEKYFLPGGGGAYFIDLYGSLENTKANLPVNLDSLYSKGQGILSTFMKNLMQASFVASVPSKFSSIINQGSNDFMGIDASYIEKTSDGKYDVRIANNGVIYMLNTMVAPDEYQSVIGPALIYPDLNVMKYFLDDKTTGSSTSVFGADMYYYLMAMKSNYAFFIPTNEAFDSYYLDPTSLGSSPRVIKFYSYDNINAQGNKIGTLVGARTYSYNVESGEVGALIDEYSKIINGTSSQVKSQVYDILNYHTIILDEGETFGSKHYYLAKNGGAVYVEDAKVGGVVKGGAQINNGMPAAHIVNTFGEKNGIALTLDHLIQPSITSVYKLLEDNSDRYTSFDDIVSTIGDASLLTWVGISSDPIVTGGTTTPQDKYIVFSGKDGKCLDNNVNFFNGYNYTFYAPNDDAMKIAYEEGLPTSKEIYDLFYQYNDESGTRLSDEDPTEEELAAQSLCLDKINALRAFIRYHFQNNSVFADEVVKTADYQSLYSDALGIPALIKVSGGNGSLKVTDAAGNSITINANSQDKIVNFMCRDYEFDKEAKGSNLEIATSSFATVHEISTPLCYSKSGRYDDNWRTSAAKKYNRARLAKKLSVINNLKD